MYVKSDYMVASNYNIGRGRDFLFVNASRPALGPKLPPTQWVKWILFPS